MELRLCTRGSDRLETSDVLLTGKLSAKTLHEKELGPLPLGEVWGKAKLLPSVASTTSSIIN